MSAHDLPTRFENSAVEKKWDTLWQEQGYFHPLPEAGGKAYSIAFPPPNVTGSLHMGHACNATLQDALIRAHRMQGHNTLWMLGTDHAGIATQYVVEKQLKQLQGQTRHDLGRDAFLERVWDWKQQYGDRIINQMHRLGASGDYERARFTMDAGYSRAVRRVFVKWFEEGLIYRGLRSVNWCTHCLTTLSELELEHEERQDQLYYIRYPAAQGKEYLTIATVRPETIFADVAVAVHPRDERYAHLIGKTVCLPLVGRELPIIADDYVDREFGTGALKITPAHDANDYEIGQRHQLPQLIALTENGILNDLAGKYQGMACAKARPLVVEELEAEGHLEKVEPYRHDVGMCYRCHHIIEPYLSEQWFVNMQPLAKPAIEAIRSGRVQFTPDRWSQITAQWLENVRDWCISRQLWWGHQIPVWYCRTCEAQNVSMDDIEQCLQCHSPQLERDPDVLDTWFSSALWPFATLGWPDQTPELAFYHPTDVLSTARDILNLWVARMIFSSLYFMEEVPFRHVLVHATILTRDGKRMSKSKGTGIDPLDMIDKYGADACRYWLAEVGMSGQDVRFSDEKLQSSQHFVTKIWNASRFILLNLEDYQHQAPDKDQLELADRWIFSRLNALAETITQSIQDFSLTHAAKQLYAFIWNEFCDWYLEIVKPRLQGDDRRQIQSLLAHCLDKTLRLLHPIMPFVTEELWQCLKPHLNTDEPHLMVARWVYPEEIPPRDREAEQQMDILMEAIRTIRNLRMEMDVPANKQAEKVYLISELENERHILQNSKLYISTLAQVKEVVIQAESLDIPQAAHGVSLSTQVILPLTGLIDFEKEKQRLEKEITKLGKEAHKISQRLSNSSFTDKAPVDVVQKTREQFEELQFQQNLLKERLQNM